MNELLRHAIQLQVNTIIELLPDEEKKSNEYSVGYLHGQVKAYTNIFNTLKSINDESLRIKDTEINRAKLQSLLDEWNSNND